MPGETNLDVLLGSMQPRLRPGEFVFVVMPAGVPVGVSVEATIAEDEGLTAVMTRAVADQHDLEYGFVAAWITLDIHSGLEAVGLTGAFSTALAAVGISCNVLAGYFHDHILVPIADADRALATLRALAEATPETLAIDEFGRAEPPLAGNEEKTLLGFLDFQRATFEWKCAGLDADGLAVAVGASSMTLAGLLKHLAYVEGDWSERWLRGAERPAPFDTVDWASEPDWEWMSAAEDDPEYLRDLWRSSVARSRESVAEALANGGLGQLAKRPWSDGRTPSLRWILTHLIEEYARHNGHADLLREAVDGVTGE